MSKSERDDLQESDQDGFSLRGVERYTMAEAARIKRVSYHTVSRAVRQGRLPVQRLGRMALISGEDLDAWEPMRARAPLRYREAAPEPETHGTPVVVDDALGGRLELARQLSALYEVMHAATTELSLEGFGHLLARRFGGLFGLPSVSVWVIQPRDSSLHRAALFGPPMSRIPDRFPNGLPVGLDRLSGWPATVTEQPIRDLLDGDGLNGIGPEGPLLLVPMRARGRVIGAIVASRDGKQIDLNETELELAQALGNQAALAIDNLNLRREELYRVAQHAAILDQVTDLVRACDLNGRLEISNRADQDFRSVDGISPPTVGEDAMVNPAIQDRFELDGRAVAPDDHPLARALRGEVVRDWEYYIRRVDGSVLRSRVNAEPLVLDGEITGAVYIGRNVTADHERNVTLAAQAERLSRFQQLSQALEDLASALMACECQREAVAVTARVVGAQPGVEALILGGGEEGGFKPVAWSGDHDFGAMATLHDPVSIPTAIQAFSRRSAVLATRAEAGQVERHALDALNGDLLVAIPLLFADQRLGVIYVICEDQIIFQPEEIALLTVGGNLLSGTLVRLQTAPVVAPRLGQDS